MTSRLTRERSLSNRSVLPVLLAAALTYPLVWGVLRAEAQAPVRAGATGSPINGTGNEQDAGNREFEVCSVKPSQFTKAQMEESLRSGSPVRRGVRVSGKRAEYIYMSLLQLIMEAYHVSDSEVKGPDWLHGQPFDVTCKMPQESSRQDAAIMLRSLLAYRFKLTAHLESTEQVVSALVVAGGGPKLKPTDDTDAASLEGEMRATHAAGGGTFSNGRLAVKWTKGETGGVRLEGEVPMAYLATMLNDMGVGNGRPVVDMTGLKGYYHVSLDIPPEVAQGMGTAVGSEAADPTERASEPAGVTSLQRSLKDLGLELATRKAPINHLNVEHAEKMPVEN